MKETKLIFILFFMAGFLHAQSLYFPPLLGKEWATTTPEQLGWCTEKIDSLYDFLQQKDSKAFMVLKDGKIVLEKYFGTFTQDSIWYWASAGKTLTGFLTGIAQEQGYLSINDKSSKYLGSGWTSLDTAQENKISIRHQLTMTTGLDDGDDPDCTLPSCLTFKAEPGTRWAYHNAPYTLMDSVIESATGKNYNQYFTQVVKSKTGMTGLWVKTGYNHIFYSNTRSMARFGILMLNKGTWNKTPVLADTVYFNAMIHSSQSMNKSYGYLTWLNGKQNYMLPGSQIVFNGSLMKDAPEDMFAAMGKNGQIINISPSLGLVVMRIGNPPNGSSGFVPNLFNNDIWKYLNKVICKTTSTNSISTKQNNLIVTNPVQNILYLNRDAVTGRFKLEIIDINGNILLTDENNTEPDISNLKPGLYYVRIISSDKFKLQPFVKI